MLKSQHTRMTSVLEESFEYQFNVFIKNPITLFITCNHHFLAQQGEYQNEEHALQLYFFGLEANECMP